MDLRSERPPRKNAATPESLAKRDRIHNEYEIARERARRRPFAGAVTLSAVAEYLHCSERQIEKLVAEGSFPPAMRVGRMKRWHADTVIRFLDNLARQVELANELTPSE